MCYDLNEYDPFEVLYLMEDYDDLVIENFPMTEDNWEEWLDFDNGPYMV